MDQINTLIAAKQFLRCAQDDKIFKSLPLQEIP